MYEYVDDIAIKHPMRDDPPGCGLTDLDILRLARKELGYDMQVSFINSQTSVGPRSASGVMSSDLAPGTVVPVCFLGAVPAATVRI